MTNPTKHPYAPELCALFNGKVIQLKHDARSRGAQRIWTDWMDVALMDNLLVEEVGVECPRFEFHISNLIGHVGISDCFKIRLKPKDE